MPLRHGRQCLMRTVYHQVSAKTHRAARKRFMKTKMRAMGLIHNQRDFMGMCNQGNLPHIAGKVSEDFSNKQPLLSVDGVYKQQYASDGAGGVGSSGQAG